MVTLLKSINLAVSIVFLVCYFYQILYMPLVIFFRKRLTARKKKGKVKIHDLAVLICARNEEKVIGDLMDSLRGQTYPRDKTHVFVLADNCADGTAQIARAAGAVVYERQNEEKIGKGYALEELLSRLKEDFPEGFDGYLVFDADNLLDPEYIRRMNECFCDGNDVITGYRNSKNFGPDWISACHALWFLRESRYLNHAHFLIGASCAVSGTGFFFSRAVAEEIGLWPYHLLTEDLEFSADRIVRGKKIAFCPEAVVYDEQPVTFRQSWLQRKRWAKGYLEVLRKYGGRLFRGALRGSFSCFDALMNIAPAYFLSLVSVACNTALAVPAVIRGEGFLPALAAVSGLVLGCLGLSLVVGAVTAITEWRVIRAPARHKIKAILTFP
ncbi:MAG: glycosyltransferase, partial [Clostridia bacterium]|nr:glycosyltransferase [Clostridia bacterium]